MTESTTRKATLEAALELYKIYNTSRPWTPSGSPEADNTVLEHLEEKAKEAVDNLAKYRRAQGIRLALDALLPGWRYLDASEYLPQDKWRTFISNKKSEWRKFLSDNGVSTKDIEQVFKNEDWTNE